MRYLLDTNIISETIKKTPCKEVSNLLQKLPAESQYLSVLTIGEIRKGIELMQNDLAKKETLKLWFETDLLHFFNGRILPINHAVAEKWGFMLGNSKNPVPAIDSLIAATALANNLILITRNSSDFEQFHLEILNPWAMQYIGES